MNDESLEVEGYEVDGREAETCEGEDEEPKGGDRNRSARAALLVQSLLARPLTSDIAANYFGQKPNHPPHLLPHSTVGKIENPKKRKRQRSTPHSFLFLSLIFSAAANPLIRSITFSGAESTTILSESVTELDAPSNNPERSSPEEKDIRSNAFKQDALLLLGSSSLLISRNSSAPELALVNLLIHNHQIRIVKRQESGGEHVENNTTRPHIDLGSVVAFLRENLRRDVGRRSAERVEQTVLADLIREGAEAEIRDFQVAVLVEEEILRLEIAVEDPARVAVTDGVDQLAEVLPAQILAEPPLSHLSEELPALSELHHEKYLGLGGEHLVEGHGVRVVEAAHDRDLPFYVPDHGGARDLLLVDHLNRHALPAPDVPRVVNLGEGAAAQEFPHLVLLEQGVLLGRLPDGGAPPVFDPRHHLLRMPETEQRRRRSLR
nr:Os05g0514250 [Ipomoea trifida]